MLLIAIFIVVSTSSCTKSELGSLSIDKSDQSSELAATRGNSLVNVLLELKLNSSDSALIAKNFGTIDKTSFKKEKNQVVKLFTQLI